MPIHAGSDFYDLAGFRAGRSTLEPFELEELGDVRGRSLLHLQCHFGMDTLSWAREGADVAGVDFSAPAIETARKLAGDLGLKARFLCGNVYDAPEVLQDKFDIVYTGKGALAWLPELGPWSEAIQQLLRPGGTLYLVEFHPFTDVFSYQDFSLAYDYFHREAPEADDTPGTYADLEAQTSHNRTYEWNHPLGDVVTALAERGLRIRRLKEHPYTLFGRWPQLQRGQDGTYRLPEGMPQLPLMFSLTGTLD
ncbi:MAG: class I SAM-dependent methyltransferase [Candidatus Dormibacteria bacterium]